jgi:uncharacterized protein YecE (DUF72 family)
MAGRIYVGTAGWSIPRHSTHRCPSEGSHLERYARVFTGAEINSSFYRAHSVATYARWAAAAPGAFRFAVKLPRLITHEHQLRNSRRPFEQFLAETRGLGSRRGPLLCQLPPSFGFDARVAARFFAMVRERHDGMVVCEPRHPTWFGAAADGVLRRYGVARVAADPAITATAGAPGGWTGVAYFRLHGAPRTYWSRYQPEQVSTLATLARQLARSADVWCIFDNTASGAAVENAWELRRLLRRAGDR